MNLKVLPNDIILLDKIGGRLEYKKFFNKLGEEVTDNVFSGEDEIRKDYQLINHAFGIEMDKAFVKCEKFNQWLKGI